MLRTTSFLLLFSTLLVADTALAQNSVAFYFAAHEDDWQLFMNPNAYRDVQSSSSKVVFVYVTAGDAGAGRGNAGRAQPYFLAREHGAKLSVKFIADVEKSPTLPSDSLASFNGHPVRRWRYRDTTSYFLRLPDGNFDGTGYRGTEFGSLKRLREGTIRTITAVDGSTTYSGWSDLAATVRELIVHERLQATSVWIHIPDPDAARNAYDHSDHRETGQVALDAVADLSCISKALYLDYISATLDENVHGSDRDVKSATFAAVSVGLNDFDHPSNWDSQHQALLGRTYVRTVAGGPC